MKKAIFLDRDGVINTNVTIISPEQLVILNGVPEAVKKINDSGYLAIIVTNQPVIAKGMCTQKNMEKIHDKMNMLLSKNDAKIDGIYICPHHPEKGFEGEVPELKFDCDCRKPKAGLILKAIKDNNIDPKQSWMIGDSYTDVEAGRRAGVKTVFLTSGGGSGSRDNERYKDVKPDITARDLPEALKSIKI